MIKEINVLFVEDSDDDVEILTLELERGGYHLYWEKVDHAHSLRQAIQTRDWDIVISDYSMPGFSGLEALRIVRQSDQIIPFVLVSGAVGEEVAVELMKLGAQDYVLKHNLIRLTSVIGRALGEAAMKRKTIRDGVELKESNRRLSIIYNHTNDCMSLLRVEHPHLVFESVNESFLTCYDQFGVHLQQEEFEGILLPYFLHQILSLSMEKVEERLAWYNKVIRTRSSVTFIEEQAHNDQIIYLESRLNPIIEKGQCRHILWVTRDITESLLSQQKIKAAYEEVARLKTQLEYENRYLQEEINLTHNFDDIISSSQEFAHVLKQVEQVAPVDTSVLITGETGTGKELIARAIHMYSERREKAFVKINCAALPRELIESELFGYEKGAFTGATQQKPGRFELAQYGSIFLDEIGDLPLDLQPKLLRVLQEEEVERLGGTQTIKLDVRIIAATNQDLKEAIAKSSFRKDLYYRLSVFPIHIPPLRTRKDDIAPLLSFFIDKYSQKFKKPIDFVPVSVLKTLEAYNWPGNVRELENLVERAMILSQNGHLPFASLLGIAEPPDHEPVETTTLREVERNHILKTLVCAGWKINGPGGAAEKLELTPTTLRDRMKKHGITRPKT